MTILEEARHSLIIIEHDPLLYKSSMEIIELGTDRKMISLKVYLRNGK
jgi:hypothetical protein